MFLNIILLFLILFYITSVIAAGFKKDTNNYINIIKLPSPPIIKNQYDKMPKPKGNIFINVKIKSNAKGDGITNDSKAIQSAIDYAANSGGGVIFFPRGTYLVYEIKLPHNVTLMGEGRDFSILKAPDRVDLLINKNSWRMFRTVTGGIQYKYEGDYDSDGLIFKNIAIDYNGPNQIGWDGKYNAEQNFCLELGASAKRPGRLKVIMDNCEVRHSVTDGISIIANVDLTVTNTVFKTNRRGSLCILGGHSIIKAKNIKVFNDLGIYAMGLQSEPCVDGYLVEGKGPQYFEFYVENALVEGRIDIGNHAYDRKGAGTVVHFKNVNARKGDLLITNGSGGRMLFENCKFGQLGSWYFLMPHDVTFNNCEFIMRRNLKDGKWPESCVRLAWNQGGTTWRNQILTFNNCTFTAEESTQDAEHVTSAVKVVLWENFDNNNKVVFNGGVVTDKLKSVIDSNYGGMATMVFKKLVTYAHDTSFRLSGGAGTGRYHATFEKVLVKNGKFARLYGTHPDCKIVYKDMVMDAEVNWLSCFNAALSLSPPTLSGNRIIQGDNPPGPDTHGLVGDLYVLRTNPNQKWRCTKNGYWHEWNKYTVPASWGVIQR